MNKKYAFSFGFVEHPIKKSVLQWNDAFVGKDPSTARYQLGVFVGTGSNFMIKFGRDGGNKRIAGDITKGWKNGDRFGLAVDFQAKSISLFYNGKLVRNNLYRQIPDKIVPAIAIYSSIVISCTKFTLRSM